MTIFLIVRQRLGSCEAELRINGAEVDVKKENTDIKKTAMTEKYQGVCVCVPGVLQPCPRMNNVSRVEGGRYIGASPVP